MNFRIFINFFLLLLLCSCTALKKNKNNNPNAVVPKLEKYSKYGNPKSYNVFDVEYNVLGSHINFTEEGIASWYGEKFHGKLTSIREVYDMYQLTAAHRSLPIPCYVKVTNLENNKSVIVRINDRGPFSKNRIIDLSYAAAKELDFIEKGTAKVHIETIDAEKY